MLLKQFEISDQMYDPINHMTQMELMEKFNLAFYEGQNLSKTDILRSFEPNFSIDYDDNTTTTTTTGSGDGPLLHDDQISERFLVDYLTDGDTPTSTTNFDFDDLDRDFDVHFSPRREARVSECTEDNFDAETFLTDDNDQFSDVFDATAMARNEEVDLSRDLLENFDLADICDSLSNHSFDFNDVAYDIYDFDNRRQDDVLPPISTLTKNNVEFNGFIRNVAPNDLQHRLQESRVKNEFGHLIRNQCTNNNVSSGLDFLQESEISSSSITNENLLVLRQDEALSRRDDPFFNSTNNSSNSDDLDDVPTYYLAECEEVSSMALICKWENCYQIYECQNSLVKHIEKCHVELKRGDEFICFWANCPRQVKPFNARYKLLIHMRVHSGEKPNKCPFKGCNKAFSRLENLKIHQRSHTGERPYLCQFSSCTKSFSNSSDRAKHQRTHFDTKPYACQVVGCLKKYTDPSSLRKHVKNHTFEEQLQIKKKQQQQHDDDGPYYTNPTYTKQFLDPQKQKAIKNMQNFTKLEHSYSNVHENERKTIESSNIKQDLKNKISLRNKLLKNLG